MAVKLTEQESQQLLQTVEMFEAIVEHQPDDYQSLEILKETYAKLSRPADSLTTSKRLARAYVKVGQLSQAILEYEGLVQEYPNDSEIKAALAELQSKTGTADDKTKSSTPPLAEHSKPTPSAGVPAGVSTSATVRARPEDGDLALAHALIAEKIVTTAAVEPLLAKLRQIRAHHTDLGVPLSLIPLLVNDQIAKHDDVLIVMLNRSRLPFVPLASYDVDRDTARLLPQDICFAHCLVPFDLVSRSVLVATANPFDQAARKQVEAMLDYHVFWFVAAPAEIVAALQHAHGLSRAKATPTQGAKT